ncbi:GMC oxidoreductase [Pedobacter heparinus]|uniref:2-keto-gluconate dehydrogenase subunit n=1 Tax=Pedobacter heparinus (strain ATCC 13125 / DSM 2366 / CIP 104194 / JCM 7457 / NBRC 12017 / NCIMB 9290 / NRRL B-14731 / HIM 762-3) TaxID=485917 RepID=C6XWA6_PEDHD|nr:GMC oxidoreductase [Pedobacter heparinus]ACU04185.1 2-keto-gluconate dehydrogenase subunit [Pedobacter heparinus DSM 2366]
MKYSQYDLIVVGTGFASSFFLKKYLSKPGSKNKKVLVLEKGHFYPHSERLKVEKGLPSAYQKYASPWQENIVNLNDKKVWQFTTAHGGSSNCWWGCTPRFMPNDFKLKSLYGVGQDWPVSYNELDPYYYEAEELMIVSGPENTPFPRKGKYPLPPHTFSLVDKILHHKYGNQYISQPTARASRQLAHRNGCLAYSTCHTCPVNAKFTIENGNMGVYEDKRIEIIYGCDVYSLETVNDMVKNVLFQHDGKELSASGEVIVLGANPFFNSNILLNAGDKNPLTGRGIGEQLGMQVQIYLDDLKNVGGSSWVNANGYMLYDGDHRKDFAACLIEVNNAPYYIRVERGKYLNVASFRMVFEDLPINSNHVAITSNKLKPEVHFKERSEYALKGIENMKLKLPGVLSCLPVEKIIYQDTEPNEGHIIGGTRMSNDKNNGVVDKHLIHHQYRNLFVLGAGAFTTYGPSNPTLTLCALSLFAADKVF